MHESHVHVMNALDCPINIRLSSIDGLYSHHDDIDNKMNRIIYDLNPGKYDIDVRVDHACAELANLKEFTKRYQLDAEEEKVTGIVIRPNSDSSLHISELTEFEQPKKYSGGDSKIRAIFDVGSKANHTLILRESSGSSSILIPSHINTGEIQETTYAKVPPGDYE